MIVKEFIECVCEQIRCRRAHPMVREELEAHIADQKDAYIKEGVCEELAESRAVAEMGDPVLVGAQLDLSHRPKPAWNVIAAAVCLTALCSVLKATLGLRMGADVTNWALYVILGAAVVSIIYFTEFHVLAKFPVAAYLLALTAAYVMSTLCNRYYNQWISYAVMTATVPFFALVVYKYRGKGVTGIFMCLLWLLAGAATTLAVPSLMSAVIVGLTGVILVTLAILKGHFGSDKRKLLFIFYTVGFLFVAVIFLAEMLRGGGHYRWERLGAMFPMFFGYKDTLGMGYWSYSMHELLRETEFFSGAVSAEALDFWRVFKTSFNYQDYYFLNYIAVEKGIWLSAGIVALFSIFWSILLRISMKQKNTLAYLVCVSVTVCFGITALLFILENTGNIHMGRSIMPFVTMEPASFLASAVLLGIYLSASKGNSYLRNKDVERQIAIGEDGPMGVWIEKHWPQYRLVVRLERRTGREGCTDKAEGEKR